MERNGGKLADVLDRVIPGHAIVHIGNHAQIHSLNARLLEHILDDPSFAGGGEEDFVNELFAGVLKKRIERPNDIGRVDDGSWVDTGKFDKALERVSKVFDALEMMPQRVSLGSGADNQDVARVETEIESAIEPEPIDQAPDTKSEGHQAHGADHDRARNVVGMDQI